jgi:hypothetical protein
MSFLNDEQRSLMLANGAARLEDSATDPYPVVKLYTLDATASWLLSELDADGDRAYGLIDAGTGFPELGHVSLSALACVRGPMGLRIVVDPYFEPYRTLSAYAIEALREGSICD